MVYSFFMVEIFIEIYYRLHDGKLFFDVLVLRSHLNLYGYLIQLFEETFKFDSGVEFVWIL